MYKQRAALTPWKTLGCTICLLGLIGCGSETVPMSGAVTLDAKPVNNGVLILIPEPNSAGPSTGSAIIEGRYEIAAAKGPRRGLKYRVQISSVDRTNASPTQFVPDSIPAEYNQNSKLTVDIPQDAHKVEQDFTLQSSKARSP